MIEILNKQRFVSGALSDLLKAVDNRVIGSAYRFDEKTYEEYVYVYFKDGSSIKVAVTADSLSAVALDVLKKF